MSISKVAPLRESVIFNAVIIGAHCNTYSNWYLWIGSLHEEMECNSIRIVEDVPEAHNSLKPSVSNYT
jgi:hypothetical protein